MRDEMRPDGSDAVDSVQASGCATPEPGLWACENQAWYCVMGEASRSPRTSVPFVN